MTDEAQPAAEEPTAADAARILSAITGGEIHHVRRFPNGLAHFVFDARLANGERFVVRLTRPQQRDDFAGALYWHQQLRAIDVPLPDLIYAELDAGVFGFPVMILERLPGVDLGNCYPELSLTAKRTIARQIVEIQRRVAALPKGSGFGYAYSPVDPSLKPTWRDVLDASLERSRLWTRTAGVLGEESIDRVSRHLDRFDDYFSAVQPVCFLHDTTTKNVLIDGETLSGIVDVDSVCYGDPLWVLSLTNMAIRSAKFDGDYVAAWSGALSLNDERRLVLSLYTAIHCVAFLGEIGQRFNKDVAPPIDFDRVAYLRQVLDQLLAPLEAR